MAPPWAILVRRNGPRSSVQDASHERKAINAVPRSGTEGILLPSLLGWVQNPLRRTYHTHDEDSIMKKLFAIIVGLCLFLTGCSSSFNWDKSVSKLEDAGYVVKMNYSTTEDITHELNSELKMHGKDDIVEVIKYTNLEKGDYTNSCFFIQFENEDQAQSYYDLRLETRFEDSNLKLAIYEDVLLMTQSSEVVDILNLDFN